MNSNIDEHSTFIPSVGELVSSVIIPHHNHGKNSRDINLLQRTIRPTASLDNLDDGLLSDFGLSNDPQPGVDNPMVGELNEDMSLSEQGSAELGDDDKPFEVWLFVSSASEILYHITRGV